MANNKSAEKRIRQTKVRTLRNKMRKTRVATYLKKVETAIANGNKALAMEALIIAQSELFKGVTKGVVTKNRASRKMSRLSARIKTLES